MIELEHQEQKNVPDWWDRFWTSRPESGADKDLARERICEILATLPKGANRKVLEYGFGGLHLARRIGPETWVGRDFSSVAVEHAHAEGFRADVLRCGQCERPRYSYVVATEVLEHLDSAELEQFLGRVHRAPHAFFSVPCTGFDLGYDMHVRTFGEPADFRRFLMRWWPYVEVERINRPAGGPLMLAHCQRTMGVGRLTVGCSTYLDYEGVWYTLTSILQHHGLFDGAVEMMVIDNGPEPDEKMRLIVEGRGARYIPCHEKRGAYVGKDRLIEEAGTPWVLTLDSHVMMPPDALEFLLRFANENDDSEDLYHIPLLSHIGQVSDFRNLGRIWGEKGEQHHGSSGAWKDAGAPYPVLAACTGAYLVRKDAWRSGRGYDPILGAFGGWEGPLDVKWWLMGRRALSMRWPEAGHRWPLAFSHVFNGGAQRRPLREYGSASDMNRNFIASAAVIGGESFAEWVAKSRHADISKPTIRAGLDAGMALRPWMVEHLARPEWEDIWDFFAWAKAEGIPGHLTEW